MLKRLALAALLASLPTFALAQSGAPTAAVCDGSEARRAERARHVGGALFYGTAVADLAAMLTIPRNPGGAEIAPSRFRFVAATAPIALVGYLVQSRAHPGEGFWERVVARTKVGETRTVDVRRCLHRPDIATSHANEERWTYVTARPSPLGGSLRTVEFVFHDSVLADLRRTEVHPHAMAASHHDATPRLPDRHHGFCSPPIPVIADPFPVPLDTTAAAAAMARAQADADAAAKNAAAAAAYAACMASDTAR